MAQRRYQDPDPKLGRDGKWRVRWRKDYINQKGELARQSKKTVLGTKAELPSFRMAKRAAVEFLDRQANSRNYRPGKIADLRQFADRWQREALPLLEGSSQAAARNHINNRLLPAFGDVNLENLRPQLIQSAVTAWAEKLERKTILNILGTLQAMMREARNWDYTVGEWRMDQLLLPSESLKPDPRCFTDEEAAKIINAASGQWKAMFCLVAMTGMRRGEVIALRWDDVDLKNLVITPHQAQWQREVKILKTKSSKGGLPIPEPLAVMLKWYKSVWRSNHWNLLFTSKVGGMLHPSAIYRDVLHPLLDKLEIPRGGFHAFRHAHSTLLVSEGANPKVFQKQMRHASSKVTLDVYTRLIEKDQREAVEKVAQRLRPLVPEEEAKSLIQ